MTKPFAIPTQNKYGGPTTQTKSNIPRPKIPKLAAIEFVAGSTKTRMKEKRDERKENISNAQVSKKTTSPCPQFINNWSRVRPKPRKEKGGPAVPRLHKCATKHFRLEQPPPKIRHWCGGEEEARQK
uniref:Uncharacterized protein n=1 Tax=Ditylenchus dipsaci TaxID=166011 RepID=A0A915D6S0_9BILA